VAAELKRALALWQWSGKSHAGSHDPKNLDSHSLARTLAVALYTRTDAQRAIDLAAEVSRTTQQSPVVLDLCRLWAALFADALSGVSKQDLLAFTGPATTLLRQRTLKPALRSLLDGSAGVEIATTNDAVTATRVAIASFAAGETPREALERAALSGRVAPDALALCGALAGAHHGIQAAPAEWRRLTDEAGLCSTARRLLG
jgi:ADP-ribosylglycohydrolase